MFVVSIECSGLRRRIPLNEGGEADDGELLPGGGGGGGAQTADDVPEEGEDIDETLEETPELTTAGFRAELRLRSVPDGELRSDPAEEEQPLASPDP